MAKNVDYDHGLQPASASLTESTRMNWSPSPVPDGATDAVSLAVSEALLEIEGAVTARVAKNNALVAALRATDEKTGVAITNTDEDGATGIGAAVPQ